jgi:hypothetical protein
MENSYYDKHFDSQIDKYSRFGKILISKKIISASVFEKAMLFYLEQRIKLILDDKSLTL